MPKKDSNEWFKGSSERKVEETIRKCTLKRPEGGGMDGSSFLNWSDMNNIGTKPLRQ